ncbi:hypothetical protein JS528_02340 [Bifidobacterium sp. MA2]|uniref:Uncharacterized protein n=1 Tax=Bifidobacterium santillanense TaxID=2809028 RepID=A0ABS5UMZ0_9BIFI|nr:hypothetical protein [Bifidobacterium santillanense]
MAAHYSPHPRRIPATPVFLTFTATIGFHEPRSSSIDNAKLRKTMEKLRFSPDRCPGAPFPPPDMK